MPPQLAPCRSCRQPIARNARVCPHCGARRASGLLVFAGWLFGLIFLGAMIIYVMQG
jgi:hypothetical protein